MQHTLLARHRRRHSVSRPRPGPSTPMHALALTTLALVAAALLGSLRVAQADTEASGVAKEDEIVPSEEPAAEPEPELTPAMTPDDRSAEPRPLPAGFVEMHVLMVMPTEMGNVVILADGPEARMVPIWIGETEALAIALRLEGDGFRRPLTHDLVDALMRELGADLVEVRIDSLESSTFVASLFIRQGDREFLLDSRASDSIALALGSHLPIFVSERVLEAAGLQPWELGVPGAVPPEGAPTSQPHIPL